MAKLFGFSIEDTDTLPKDAVSPVPPNDADGVEHYMSSGFFGSYVDRSVRLTALNTTIENGAILKFYGLSDSASLYTISHNTHQSIDLHHQVRIIHHKYAI